MSMGELIGTYGWVQNGTIQDPQLPITSQTGRSKMRLWIFSQTVLSIEKCQFERTHMLTSGCTNCQLTDLPFTFQQNSWGGRKLSKGIISEHICWMWSDAFSKSPNSQSVIKHKMWPRQATWSPLGMVHSLLTSYSHSTALFVEPEFIWNAG